MRLSVLILFWMDHWMDGLLNDEDGFIYLFFAFLKSATYDLNWRILAKFHFSLRNFETDTNQLTYSFIFTDINIEISSFQNTTIIP